MPVEIYLFRLRWQETLSSTETSGFLSCCTMHEVTTNGICSISKNNKS